MRFRWLAAVAVGLLTCGFASAQPKDSGPTIELRLRSVNDLVGRFEYVAGLAGKENEAGQVRELLKALSADGKGIEGIDPKKPIGAYITLAKEVETSPFVIMLPIADEEQFLKALNKHLGITAEKGDDGTHKIPVPALNELHLRFTNGYLYASPKVKDLDAKALVKPEAYFGKDDGSAASLVAHIDRIPADLRTFVLGQFEMGINEARKKEEGKGTAAEEKLKNLVFDSIVGGAKGLADDGKELSAKFFIDPKTDAISAEVTLTAKSGSPLAKQFSSLGQQTSLPAGIVGSVANPVARGSVKLAVPEGMKKDYSTAIDDLLAQAAKDVPADAEQVVKDLVAAISPTLKAGELDAAAALVGPDAKGRYQLIGAVAVKDGKKIETFLKDTVKQFGPMIEGEVTIKFDVETVGDFKLHRVDLKNAPEKFEKAFGTSTIWVATSDSHIAFSIEPDGEALKKGLKAKAAQAPIAVAEVSAGKLIPLAHPDLKPDELKALMKDAFGDGDPAGKDTLTLSVQGGDKLTAKFLVKGKAVRLFAGLSVVKGE